ncbi:MAG TPA: DUF6158 family protein [Sporichthyaceae bacterium]|jgi:hypothetical protein
MTDHGVPASELSDSELAHQGTQAHATRNWVFLHGTAQQFRRHTERMLELEQEYLRRHPKRTWQGSGGAEGAPGEAFPVDPERATQDLLRRYVAAPDGRLHKLEAHQAAREVGLPRAEVAALFKADPPLLRTSGQYREITDAGRALVPARTA